MKQSLLSDRVFYQTVDIVRKALALKGDSRSASPMEADDEEDDDDDDDDEKEEEPRSILDYQDSDSPVEQWDDDQEEWPIKGIVGEEVNSAGDTKSVPRPQLLSRTLHAHVLYRYEVSWEPWERADGTCGLWMRDIPDRPDLVKKWKRKQKRKRRELAEEDLDIEVTNDIDIHNLLTLRRSQGFAEKLEKRKKNPINYKDWDLELGRNLLNKGHDVPVHVPAPRSSRSGSERGRGVSSASSSTLSQTQSLRASTSRTTLSPGPTPGPSRLSAPHSVAPKPKSSSTPSAPPRASPRPLPQRAGKGKEREVVVTKPPRSVLVLHVCPRLMFLFCSGERSLRNRGTRS